MKVFLEVSSREQGWEDSSASQFDSANFKHKTKYFRGCGRGGGDAVYKGLTLQIKGPSSIPRTHGKDAITKALPVTSLGSHA